jgi:hypothetical protein
MNTAYKNLERQTFEPKSGVKSNMDSVAQSMVIEPEYKKSWALLRRNPKIIADSVRNSRAEQAEKLTNLLTISEKQNYGVKKFLVVKKFQGLFAPIGFRRTFKKIEDVIKFAATENRQTVRVITGAVKKDYPVNN